MLNITPVILAAGDSLRMGYPKALLPLGTDTFLTRILKTLDRIRLSDAWVVLGKHESRIRPLLRTHHVRILVNSNPARGQVSSIRLAAENLDPECQGCLIWPVDHPLVSAELVLSLARLFISSAAPLALPCRGSRTGHPAIFGRALIEELLAEPPETSPKLIVFRHRNEVAWLETEETGTVEDIDTPDDYFRVTGETLEAALARRQSEGRESESDE